MLINKPRKNSFFAIILVTAAFIISAVCVITGAYIQEGYKIEIGRVAQQKFKAPRKIENTVQTNKNMQAALDAANKLDPVTQRDTAVNENVKSKMDNFFQQVFDVRRESTPIFNPYSEMNSDSASFSTPYLGLTESNFNILLSLETKRYNSFVEQLYSVAGAIMDRGIQEMDSKTLMSVKDEMDKLDLSSDMRNLGYQILIMFLEPNVTINEEATQRARDERALSFETIYYQQDQTIVDEGNIITLEAYTALEELGLVNKSYTEYLAPISAALLLILSLFTVTLVYIYFYCSEIISNRKESFLLFTIFVIAVVFARLMIDLPYQFIPILMCTLLVAMLIDSRLAIVFNMCVTIICYVIINGSVNFFIYYSVCGVVVALISSYTTDRNKIIISSFIASFATFIVFVLVGLLIEKKYTQELMQNSFIAAVSGMITVILSFGSLPIWEASFGVVTAVKLLDLTNPSSKLLRRMTLEAPGTYHHCLIVANLAETAAYDIGANSNLARAGAYYHDVGKLKYPMYFIENQAGENPHDLLEPYSSAQVILSHVSYGLELAEQYKLPKILVDFIMQHHGNTVIKYFYYKAKKENPDTEIDENDFRYNYPVPQFKEAAIVMLADTVEAAVRSMIPSGKSMAEVEEFIRKLVNDKLEDGQLMESCLTIKDIEVIVKSFVRVFTAMYHERIPYNTGDKPAKK